MSNYGKIILFFFARLLLINIFNCLTDIYFKQIFEIMGVFLTFAL